MVFDVLMPLGGGIPFNILPSAQAYIIGMSGFYSLRAAVVGAGIAWNPFASETGLNGTLYLEKRPSITLPDNIFYFKRII